jgi:hypothetical protein
MDKLEDQGIEEKTKNKNSSIPLTRAIKMNNPVTLKPAEVIWAELKDDLGRRHKDSSLDNMKIYLDPLCELGWIPMILLHETEELMKMAEGKSYPEAHHLATRAEYKFCVDHGISLDEYNRAYHLKLKKLDKRDPKAEDPADIFNGTQGVTEKNLIDEEYKESPIYSTGTLIIDNPVTHKPTEVTWIELNDGLAGRRKDASVDNMRVYIDPLCELGWFPMVILHETVELMHMAKGMRYTEAHHLATQAEKDYCKEHRISWDEYNNGYHLALRKLEHRDPNLKDPDDMFYGDKGETEKDLIDKEGKALVPCHSRRQW